tara:strand:- start:3338 stop:5476 length:2139 start_codon:yes stop_codon:yes gene_type:complete
MFDFDREKGEVLTSQYRNKPYEEQMLRVIRALKKVENLEKPKKKGFYLQLGRKITGNAEQTKEILRKGFEKKLEISPKSLIINIQKIRPPKGPKTALRKETGFQRTQRLVPDTTSSFSGDYNPKSTADVLINKTVSAYLYGDIFKRVLAKYKNDKYIENTLNKLSSVVEGGHFDNAAAFIRWTNLSDNWIHIDAFQTDFFNQVKGLISDKPISKGHPKEKMYETFQGIVRELMAKEIEFFKTAFSYIKRRFPQAKIWTANTPELVEVVERLKGKAKLQKHYKDLPKKLGFKKITVGKLFKILETRPGKKTKGLKKLFGDAVYGKMLATEKGNFSTQDIRELNWSIADNLISGKKVILKGEESSIQLAKIDSLISNAIRDYAYDWIEDIPLNVNSLESIYHQYLNELLTLLIKREKTVVRSDVRYLLNRYVDKISDEYNKTGEAKDKLEDVGIWWANRGMLFEDTAFRNFITEVTTKADIPEPRELKKKIKERIAKKKETEKFGKPFEVVKRTGLSKYSISKLFELGRNREIDQKKAQDEIEKKTLKKTGAIFSHFFDSYGDAFVSWVDFDKKKGIRFLLKFLEGKKLWVGAHVGTLFRLASESRDDSSFIKEEILKALLKEKKIGLIASTLGEWGTPEKNLKKYYELALKLSEPGIHKQALAAGVKQLPVVKETFKKSQEIKNYPKDLPLRRSSVRKKIDKTVKKIVKGIGR